MGQVAARRKKNTRRSNRHYLICLNTHFHWISTHRRRYSVCIRLLVPQQPYYRSTVKTWAAQSNNAPNKMKAIVPVPFAHTVCWATCYVLSALRDIAPKQIQFMVFFSTHKTNWREIETAQNEDARRTRKVRKSESERLRGLKYDK